MCFWALAARPGGQVNPLYSPPPLTEVRTLNKKSVTSSAISNAITKIHTCQALIHVNHSSISNTQMLNKSNSLPVELQLTNNSTNQIFLNDKYTFKPSSIHSLKCTSYYAPSPGSLLWSWGAALFWWIAQQSPKIAQQ